MQLGDRVDDRAVGAAGAPLLESKLQVPRPRRGVVQRARLDQHLDRDGLPAVVLVSAPAGFGKTTLLAEWLAAADDKAKPAAWLSLDRRDSDPAVFWFYVVAAVRKVAAEVGADALRTLQSTPTALEAVVTSLLNVLAALADDVVLVLDDYHVVESLDVQESMLLLVEHLPEQLHLIVASRADPPWPLAGLRARGEFLENRASDLRFTSQEAAAYLNDAMGLDLTPRTSMSSKPEPRDGSRPFSLPPCPSEAGTTRERSSPSSPATTASSSTTSSTRSARPTTSGRSSSRPRS